MKLEKQRWESLPALAADYIYHFGRVRQLYGAHFSDPAAWEKRAEWLSSDNGAIFADRKALAEVLAGFNEKIGNSKKALENIERLKDPQTLVVAGGQQAGLFTGPLMVIYKALTLIRTARWAEDMLNRPVVPVFWIAGEDHDFEEVNHIHYLSSNFTVEKIRLPLVPEKRTSVHRIAIPFQAWEEVLGQLEDSLTPTEFRDGLMAEIRRMALSSGSLAECFARILAFLFAEYGLVFINSDDPAVRRLEAPMFEEMLNRHEKLDELFRQQARVMEQQGYSPQVELKDRMSHIFLFHEGERMLLYGKNGGFTDRKSRVFFKQDELLRKIKHSPENFSNNVLTRPLMQEFLFPVLAAVLGPSEIAYWGLTGLAFQEMNFRMPILVPRMSFTLLEGIVQKHMDKFGWTFQDVVGRFKEKKEEWLKIQDEYRLDERFEEVRRRFVDLYSPLVSLLGNINPGLKNLGQTNMEKILEQIAFLQNRALEAQRSLHDAALRQMERIVQSLLPLGKPQERVFNVLAYLNRYGKAWLDELVQTAGHPDGMHTIVYF